MQAPLEMGAEHLERVVAAVVDDDVAGRQAGQVGPGRAALVGVRVQCEGGSL